MTREEKGTLWQAMMAMPGRIAFLLLIFVVWWVPIPWGSNRLWATVLLELVSYSIFALALIGWVGQGARLPGSWIPIGGVWLAWLGWIWVQTLPFDQPLLQQLAPHQADIYRTLADSVIPGAALHTSISVDAELTRQYWLESVAYFALFVGAGLLCRNRPHRQIMLLWMIFLSGVVQAVYGSLMTLSGLEWGAFTHKLHYLGSATGTFVNRNHFAGYLELALACGLGLLVAYSRSTGGGWRDMLRVWLLTGGKSTVIRLLLMFIVIGLITSRSRAGNAAALAGVGMALSALMIVARGGVSWRWGGLFLLGFLAVDVLVLGSWFGGGLVERYYATSPETEYRARLWPDLVQMMNAYWLSGSGLGSFALSYPEFHSAQVRGSPQEAHNDYVQFWIETGLVGVTVLGLLVLLMLAHTLRVLRRRRDMKAKGAAIAALSALISLGLHASVDFNLQIPANAATLVVILGLVWAVDPTSQARRKRVAGMATPPASG